MPLWLAVLLFIVCTGIAIFFVQMIKKEKNPSDNKYLRNAILIIFITVLSALALLVYIGFAFIFIDTNREAPPSTSSNTTLQEILS